MWKGNIPGIYTSWHEFNSQIKGYEGALYKTFNNRPEADIAYNSSPDNYVNEDNKSIFKTLRTYAPEVEGNSISIYSVSSNNPGLMEYRGVYTATGDELFRFGPTYGTDNIGDFLAIIHGLAYIKQIGWDIPIYTENQNAIKWIEAKKCNTKLKVEPKSIDILEHVFRAEYWLLNNVSTSPILKWNNQLWGDNPALFERK